MVVIFQALVPILILCLLPTIPESPIWYIQHGQQVEKAREALRRVRTTEQEVEDEILVIREAIEFEKEAISSSYSALWKDRSVRKRLFPPSFSTLASNHGTGNLEHLLNRHLQDGLQERQPNRPHQRSQCHLRDHLYPQRHVDSRSLWTKVPVHRWSYRHVHVYAVCHARWR